MSTNTLSNQTESFFQKTEIYFTYWRVEKQLIKAGNLNEKAHKV